MNAISIKASFKLFSGMIFKLGATVNKDENGIGPLLNILGSINTNIAIAVGKCKAATNKNSATMKAKEKSLRATA
jgi:hypothetical protein